ncbi:MAG: DUF805 domain-containing protein [Chloroflexota bacterium]|nr:DUF805 domain-containing protein [Chloroflexota bacterium]
MDGETLVRRLVNQGLGSRRQCAALVVERQLLMGTIAVLLFDPRGRIDRGEFWKAMGCLLAIAVLITLAVAVMAAVGSGTGLVILLIILPSILLSWCGLAGQIKRLRDCGISPWWQLTGLIPLVGAIASLVLFIICGFRPAAPPPAAHSVPPSPPSASVRP